MGDCINYSFNVGLAQKYGLNEAIILQNLIFWIDKNIANKKNGYDGYYWTYNSVTAFQELFPFLSEKQIRSALKNLEDRKVIKTGCYNKKACDRTKWYTIIDTNLLNCQMDCTKGQNHLDKRDKIICTKGINEFVQKGEPIPDIKPYDKPDINTDISLSSDKSDNESAVTNIPIYDIPKKQEKKIYTRTWKGWVDLYDGLHKGSGGGLIHWKAEVGAYKDIINMLSPEITETRPLITLLFQIYQYTLNDKFVSDNNIDLTPNKLIKFISKITQNNPLKDHYELLKAFKSYESFCEYYMSSEEKQRFDIGEVKDE